MKRKLSVRVFALIIFVALANFTSAGIENDLPGGEISPEEVRFAVIGDTGTGSQQQFAVARQMLQIQEKSRFDL